MGGRARDFTYGHAGGSGAWHGGAVVRERKVGLPGEVDGTADPVTEQVEADAANGHVRADGRGSAEPSELDSAHGSSTETSRGSAEPSAPDSELTPGSERGADPAADTAPDPDAEAESLEELGNEIATIAAGIHAAEYQLLVRLEEFDRRGGWQLTGHRSCAAWLAHRAGKDEGACRQRVRAARVLVTLPLTSAAMERGELSFTKVRALTRLATPETEAAILEYALSVSAKKLEAFVRDARLYGHVDAREYARRQWEAREFVAWVDEHGMVQFRGRMPAVDGLPVMRVLQGFGLAVHQGAEDGRTDRQRRADAFLMVAEQARVAGTGDLKTDVRVGLGAAVEEDSGDVEGEPNLAAEPGDGSRGSAEPDGHGSDRGSDTVLRGSDDSSAEPTPAGDVQNSDESRGSAEPDGLGSDAVLHGSDHGSAEPSDHGSDPVLRGSAEPRRAPISPRAERYLVMLNVEPQALVAGEQAERCHLDDGTRVTGESARRLTCDCGRVEVTRCAHGSVLDVGRKTRQISTPMRRALDARDGGCRFPGCGLRFTKGHHILHWGDGGPTKLDNLVLLCHHHHTLVHEGGFSMDMPQPGRPNFYDRKGRPVPEAPPPLEVTEALEALHRQRGIRPGPYASAPRYARDGQVPWAIEAAAMEAADPA
ncbi:MAG: DUF222 domain-containing protein, partial [Gemmatimonadota bacterium]